MDSVFWLSIGTAVGALLIAVYLMYKIVVLMNQGSPDDGEE